MNPLEATDCLLHDLPELSQTISTTGQPVSIYQTIQAFVQLTCQQVTAHNYKAAKHCFLLADKLYEQGNAVVRQAIENVFVFSLDRVFKQAREEKMEVRGLVPGSLYSVYMRQVMHGGC